MEFDEELAKGDLVYRYIFDHKKDPAYYLV